MSDPREMRTDVPVTGPDGPDPLQRGRDQVVAALDRLAQGTFARCDVCGDQIDDRRLRVEPAADRCPRHRATTA